MKFLLISLTLLCLTTTTYAKDVLSSGNIHYVTLHKPNYFLPGYYSKEATDTNINNELSFQFSLSLTMFQSGAHSLSFAYTQKSFWQVYDAAGSRPFRETNYNPEFFYRYGGSKRYIDLGIEHESNGEGEPKSRSWDRIFTRMMYLNKKFRTELKLWAVYEQDSHDPILTERHYTMEHFMGHGELTLSVLMGDAIYKVMGRLNPSTGYGYQQHWLMYPLKGALYFTLYYSQGYGDSLRDYQKSVTTYGAGVLLNP